MSVLLAMTIFYENRVHALLDSSHLHELSEGTGMFGSMSFHVESELLYVLREKEEVTK